MIPNLNAGKIMKMLHTNLLKTKTWFKTTLSYILQAKNQQERADIREDVGKALEGKLSPLQALFSPPGLQQMQQFLQQVANNGNVAAAAAAGAGTGGAAAPGFNPTQLHHLMQQQQSFLSHHQVSNIIPFSLLIWT